MPLISVITPVYNNKKYLINCVNSVSNQQFDDYEHIIVDDGSTDGTSELCDEIAKGYDKVRVIHQENQWIYASFNNGISVASGRYIYILNSDDTLENGALKKMEHVILEHDPDVIWTQVRECICDDMQNIVNTSIVGLANALYGKDMLVSGYDENHNIWRELYYYGYSINQANLYRRELAIKHPFRNDYYGADSLFNISIANDIAKSYVLSDPVYNYYNYKTNSMNASVGKVYGYEFEMYREILSGHTKLIKKWNGKEEDIRFFENLQMNTCINCVKLLHHPLKKLTSEQKIDKLLGDYFTQDFMNEIEDIESYASVDAIVTKELLNIVFTKEFDDYCNKYLFIKKFFSEISSLTPNLDVIKEMINNKLNPCHFGVGICAKKGIDVMGVLGEN